MKKTINIDGRKLDYEVEDSSSEWGVDFVTKFYEGELEIKERKYYFFGPITKYKLPKLIFSIWGDIECPSRTKEQCRKLINKELKKYDKITKRKEEISNGKLID